MEYLTLNTGAKMPLEGFGVFQIPDPKQCEQVVYDAIKTGYRLLDTAAAYGNEEALGKGVDRACAAFRAAGAEKGILDLGGNVTVIGSRPDGGAWRVAVKDPQDTERYLCVLSLSDVTASTSGGYERYFEEDGVRYHHIIDPRTGWPAESGLLSVTVVSADAVLADVLSTSLFVAGEEQALDFWRGREDIELILCTADGRVLVTEGLSDGFQPAEDGGYSYETVRR